MYPFARTDRALVSSVVAGRAAAAGAFARRFWRFLLAVEGQYAPDLPIATPVHAEWKQLADSVAVFERDGPREVVLDLWADGFRLLRDWTGEGDLVDYLGPIARLGALRRSWSTRPFRRDRDAGLPIETLFDLVGPKPVTLESRVHLLRLLQRLPARDYQLLHRKFVQGDSSAIIGAATSRSAHDVEREIVTALVGLRWARRATPSGLLPDGDPAGHPTADQLTALWTDAFAPERDAPHRRHLEDCSSCRERLAAWKAATHASYHPERVREIDLDRAQRWARFDAGPREGTLSVYVDEESEKMQLSFAAPADRRRERITESQPTNRPRIGSVEIELSDGTSYVTLAGDVRRGWPLIRFLRPSDGRDPFIEWTSDRASQAVGPVDPGSFVPAYPIPPGTSRLVLRFHRPWHIRIERHDSLPRNPLYRKKPERVTQRVFTEERLQVPGERFRDTG